ncbi:MAG: CheY-like chemotaxis protein, partial [Gammaproteobacteria bacterium]
GNSKGLEATRELLERQEELVKARMRAEESERIQERFFATISHEMRNPLNGILGMTDCLLDTELSDEQRLQATIISRGGDQLLAVINDVLDLSKAKHGGIQLESVVVSISDVIGEAVAMIGHQATQKGLVINYDPWAMQATGLGDPLRLRQICLNLISNAIKFTEEGSVSVVLQESPSSTLEREVLRITVADTGIGMTEEAKAEIFMPFQQAEAETTRRFGGTGLGLSIVAQLVELMEGEVAVESELGKGTSLHVDIPFEICEEPTVVNLSQIENSVSGAVSQIDLRVLVAEDNAVNQLVITRMLARLGCKVSMASNGREAVELATNGEFDLILMDLQMPEMDGCEASRRIRQAEQAGKTRIPILALTGSEMGMQACFEAGMDGYLTKPIRSEGLIEALQLHG